MVIKIEKEEAMKILIEHLKGIFPNALITAQKKYGDFEFEVLKEEKEKAIQE